MLPQNSNDYSKIIIQQLGITGTEQEIKKKKASWWYNQRNKTKGGLRLTDAGLDLMIIELKLESIEVEFESQVVLTPQILLALDRHLSTPYYISPKSITLFSEKTRTELFMFNDDLKRLGVVLSNKK